MSMPMMMAPADVVNFVAPQVNFELINFTNTNNIFIFMDYLQNLQTIFGSCLRLSGTPPFWKRFKKHLLSNKFAILLRILQLNLFFMVARKKI